MNTQVQKKNCNIPQDIMHFHLKDSIPTYSSTFHRASGLLKDVTAPPQIITTFDHVTNKTSQSTLSSLRQLCSRITACFQSLIKSSHTPTAWQQGNSQFQKKIKKKQHKEDLLTSFFFFGIKCATCRLLLFNS